MKNFIGDVIDIQHDVDIYNATLGHKTNNNFAPNTNAEIGDIDHPRFGPIKMVYATKSISKGEEIFFNYGYNPTSERTKRLFPWYVKQFSGMQNCDHKLMMRKFNVIMNGQFSPL